MSTFIYRLARASWHARKRVVALWLAVLVVLGGTAALSGGKFDNEFVIPGASSQEALNQLKMTFPQAAMSTATVVVIAPEGMKADSPAIRGPIERAAESMKRIEFVDEVQLPYNEHLHGMVSEDGRSAILTVMVGDYQIADFTPEMRQVLVDAGADLQRNLPPGSEVHVGGQLFSMNLPKLSAIEAIGVGVAVVVLFLTLGSLRAALMPLASALLGAVLSILLIVTSAAILPINSTTMMLALMLALAVGIDYSLFIVSRHRDQLMHGMDAEESAARATATAGSAVVFAGITVIIALVGLGLAGMPFLTTMGVFAALAVAIEVALAVTLLPAMLGFAGEKLRPKKARRVASEAGASVHGQADEAEPAHADAPRGETDDAPPAPRRRFDPSAWWVGVITKWPLVTVLVVVTLLGALALPAQHLRLALPNSGWNEPTAQDRVTFDVVADRFGPGHNGPLVVTGTIVESKDPMGIVNGVADEIRAMEGVHHIAAAVPNPNADTMMIQVVPTTGPDDPATGLLVEKLRGQADEWETEYGVKTAVTGYTAVSIDVSNQLGRALFPFGVFVMGLSLVLLTVVFRSIWVPLKAAGGYLLSTGAAFGLATLVFNDGVGRELINLHEPQPIISFLPIILMGILFGLAMDYEVFLTTRMREEHVHGNTTDPVEKGFVHSAKVVVAAALIMVAVFAFFVPHGDATLKPIAFGLAAGVAIDAFLVRMTLGPALMKLLGDHAWWLPRGLDKRLPVLDAEGEGITHQLTRADWPEAQGHAVRGEGLRIALEDSPLLADVDLAVRPGETLLATGDAAATRALTLALSGRLPLTSGELTVLGLVLPEQAGELRRSALFVDGTDAEASATLDAAREPLVVVDDADRLPATAAARVAALAADPDTTLVLAGSDASTLARLAGPAASVAVDLHATDVLAPGGAK